MAPEHALQLVKALQKNLEAYEAAGKSAKLSHPNLPPRRSSLGSPEPPVRKKAGGAGVEVDPLRMRSFGYGAEKFRKADATIGFTISVSIRFLPALANCLRLRFVVDVADGKCSDQTVVAKNSLNRGTLERGLRVPLRSMPEWTCSKIRSDTPTCPAPFLKGASFP